MNLTVASSPHIRGDFRSSRIMLDVMLALVPALIVGIWFHGFRALVVTLVSIAACTCMEWLYSVVTKTRNTVVDGSALVTGMLLAMTFSGTLPVLPPKAGTIRYRTPDLIAAVNAERMHR